MPIKYVTKEKPKAKAKTKVAPKSEAMVLVDTLGELKAQIDPIKEQLDPLAKAYAKAEASLLAIIDEENAAETKVAVAGESYGVEAGPKANATIITDLERTQEILEEVEDGLFMLLAKIGITDLRKYMTPGQVEEVTSTERTGKRKIKIEKLPE